MATQFNIQSSDPALLEQATRIAREFAQEIIGADIVGVVFLGAIARGYFDRSADIDIAIFKKKGSPAPFTQKFFMVEGIEVQVWLSDYEDELTAVWEMSRRWTYDQVLIYYDPQGKIAQLLKENVPLSAEERKWLMMAGLTLSEWYVNRLTRLWVERGNLISAHHMFDQGLLYFFDLLFGLNNELVADTKWRYYCVAQLERLPNDFAQRIQAVMTLSAITEEELARRKAVFMDLWEEMRPVIEGEVGMTYQEMEDIV